MLSHSCEHHPIKSQKPHHLTLLLDFTVSPPKSFAPKRAYSTSCSRHFETIFQIPSPISDLDHNQPTAAISRTKPLLSVTISALV